MQTQHSEQRESKRPRIVKENRFTITSAAHQERVERKRREWREKKGERKARKLLQEGEVSSEEDTGKRSPVAEKHLVENGGNQGQKWLSVDRSEWNLPYSTCIRLRDCPFVMVTIVKKRFGL